jgi:hypothetical protein
LGLAFGSPCLAKAAMPASAPKALASKTRRNLPPVMRAISLSWSSSGRRWLYVASAPRDSTSLDLCQHPFIRAGCKGTLIALGGQAASTLYPHRWAICTVHQLNSHLPREEMHTCTANDPTAPAAPIMITHSELSSTFFGTRDIFSPRMSPRQAVCPPLAPL